MMVMVEQIDHQVRDIIATFSIEKSCAFTVEKRCISLIHQQNQNSNLISNQIVPPKKANKKSNRPMQMTAKTSHYFYQCLCQSQL